MGIYSFSLLQRVLLAVGKVFVECVMGGLAGVLLLLLFIGYFGSIVYR